MSKMRFEVNVHVDAVSIYMDDTNVLWVHRGIPGSEKEWLMFDTTTDEEMCEDLDGTVDEIVALAVKRFVKWYEADGGATWRARNEEDEEAT